MTPPSPRETETPRDTVPFAAWVTLGVLILTSLAGFIDRQVLSFMVGPIKQDLGLSDVQISLLQGFAFAAFYAIAAIPIGWLMDRSHRLRLLALGIFLWSLMTAAGGLAQSFTALFAARLGVGVGEATLGPAAHGLIADHFPRARLPLAMSIYGLGVALGAGLGYALGGALVQHVLAGGSHAIPGLAWARPWQAVFIIVGLPGLVLVPLLLFAAREPARHVAASPPPATAQANALATGLGTTLGTGPALAKLLVSRAGAFLPLIGGACCLTANSFAALNWAPELLHRQWGLAPREAGAILGGLMVVGPLPGGLACGWLAGRLVRRGDAAGPLLVMGLCGLIPAPFILLACTSTNAPLALAALMPAMLLGQAYVGLAPAAVQGLTPPSLRGQAAATYLLATSLLGASIGPTAVALLSSHVLGGEAALGPALGLAACGFSAMGGVLMLAGRAAYRRHAGSGPGA